MKTKIFVMMFLNTTLGVVLTYVSFSLIANKAWLTYEFLNTNKEYGVIPIIAGFLFGVISCVNLICTFIYTHDQDCFEDDSPRWFLIAYGTVLATGLTLALIVYSLTFLNALIVILLVLFSLFGLTLVIKFFDEIKTWFKTKFVSDKEAKEHNKEYLEWQEKRKEQTVRDYANKCRNKL